MSAYGRNFYCRTCDCLSFSLWLRRCVGFDLKPLEWRDTESSLPDVGMYFSHYELLLLLSSHRYAMTQQFIFMHRIWAISSLTDALRTKLVRRSGGPTRLLVTSLHFWAAAFARYLLFNLRICRRKSPSPIQCSSAIERERTCVCRIENVVNTFASNVANALCLLFALSFISPKVRRTEPDWLTFYGKLNSIEKQNQIMWQLMYYSWFRLLLHYYYYPRLDAPEPSCVHGSDFTGHRSHEMFQFD